MLGLAQFIGLLATATSYIAIVLGAINPDAVQGLARRDVGHRANGFDVKALNVVARQGPYTVTVTVYDCATSNPASFGTTTFDTSTATTTVQTTISTSAIPVPGSAEPSITPVATMSSESDTIVGSGAVPTSTIPTPAPDTQSSPTPVSSETATTAPPAFNSATGASFTDTSFSDTSTIAVPTSGPTSSVPKTSAPAPTGSAALLQIDIICAMAAVGLAAWVAR